MFSGWFVWLDQKKNQEKSMLQGYTGYRSSFSCIVSIPSCWNPVLLYTIYTIYVNYIYYAIIGSHTIHGSLAGPQLVVGGWYLFVTRFVCKQVEQDKQVTAAGAADILNFASPQACKPEPWMKPFSGLQKDKTTSMNLSTTIMVLERVLGNMSWFLMMQRGLDLFWDNLNLHVSPSSGSLGN